MKINGAKIKSYWRYETGRWSEGKRSFVDRKWSSIQEKMLDVVVELYKDKKGDRPILQFKGGPTGFESYYIEDLLRDIDSKIGKLYICVGTINRWNSCWVEWKDLKYILKELTPQIN